MIFNFVVDRDYENISITKISRFTVLLRQSGNRRTILLYLSMCNGSGDKVKELNTEQTDNLGGGCIVIYRVCLVINDS